MEAPMTMRVLIISDRFEFRQSLGNHVMLEWNSAHAAEYEPALRGRLRSGFTGSAYDVVLLDHEVQDGRGLEWLEDLAERPAFPPIIYFAPADTGQLQRKALTSGASHVLARGDFEHAHLIEALRDALA